MQQHEYVGVESQVIEFLRGREEARFTSKVEQVVALEVFDRLCQVARLPEVPVSFDDAGDMSIGMSNHDVATLRAVFDRRFSPHIEKALECRNRLNRILPRPDEPDFLDDSEKAHVRMEKGDLGLLKLLGEEEGREFEGYLKMNATWSRATEGNSKVPETVWRAWDKANKNYHFPSLEGEYRENYDRLREMREMDVSPAVV